LKYLLRDFLNLSEAPAESHNPGRVFGPSDQDLVALPEPPDLVLLPVNAELGLPAQDFERKGFPQCPVLLDFPGKGGNGYDSEPVLPGSQAPGKCMGAGWCVNNKTFSVPDANTSSSTLSLGNTAV